MEEYLDALQSNSGLLTLKFKLLLWMSITRRNRVIDYQRKLSGRITQTFWTTNLWQLHVLSFFTKNTDPLANQNAKINIFYWGKSKRFFVGRTIWEQFTSKTVVTHFTSLLVTESATTERKSRVLQQKCCGCRWRKLTTGNLSQANSGRVPERFLLSARANSIN